MTIQEMRTNLSNDCEDPSGTKFFAPQQYEALNNAQLTVVRLLHRNYLTEIGAEKSGLALTGGVSAALNASSLGYVLIKGNDGIISVKILSSGRFATKLENEEIALINNTFYDGSDIDPTYIVIGGKLFVRPTSIASVDVNFIRKPATLTASIDCELNESLHEIVVQIAESELWASYNKTVRSEEAWKKATQKIAAMNAVYAQSK